MIKSRNRARPHSLILLIFCVTILAVRCSDTDGISEGDPNKSTIILVSVDAFRWDYPEKTNTPNLDFFISSGVRAKALIPCFPTKTFPNHYSIVTGLYPENHGIIANNMNDPELQEKFSLGNRGAVSDGRWGGGEPIWVTAEKQGLMSAPYFWPGSEAEIKGVRPTYWHEYDGGVPNEARVEQVLNWLDVPVDKRPSFMTVYFSLLDDAGHDSGPDSQEVVEALEEIDSLVGQLKVGLEDRQLLEDVNVIIVSDHGMAEIRRDQVVILDDYIDLSKVEVIDWSPILGLNPKPGNERDIYRSLKGKHPNLKVYRKAEIPERLHYRKHPRIPQILAIADDGWSITSRSYFEERPYRFEGGAHGFDNQLASMGGIFIARGPAFRSGLTVDSFQNIHVYNLMARILNLEPAPNDGELDSVRIVLRKEFGGRLKQGSSAER